MNITLKDVARHANVSTKTVSRVVNNQSEISAATRARVQSAIQELGYRPNILARSLVNKRSNTIAVVASGIEYFGPSRAIIGIEQHADAFGYSLALNLLPDPENDNVKPILDELIARRVDGIVWAVPEIGGNHDWLQAENLDQLPPIVLLSMGARADLSIVAVDNRAGAKLAVTHLLEQGRRRVGIITGPLDWWEAHQRLLGWQDTLTRAGLDIEPRMIVGGDWNPPSGERAMETLLAQVPELDAVFACNDQMALGALGILHRAGKRVPQDIAVVGFDNLPESPFFLPPLTTVHQQVIEIGRAAVQELHAQIDVCCRNEFKRAETRQLVPTLIVRASSKPI